MIIGIAGGTCSGKSTLADLLVERWGATSICVDDFYRDWHTFPISYGYPDYERIEALDWDRVGAAIRETGRDEWVIVNGFLLLAHPATRELLDRSSFIDMDEEVLIERRMEREEGDRPDYITRLIRDRHRSLVVPSSTFADVIIDGRRTPLQVVDDVELDMRAQGYLGREDATG